MPSTIFQLYRHIESFTDARPPVACQPGCSHCCHLAVDVTAAELVTLVQHLAASRSAPELARIRESAEAYAVRVERLPGTERESVRHACPLLVDNRCSVYEVRPIHCRGFHSSSAEHCAEIIPAGSDSAFTFPDRKRLEICASAADLARQSAKSASKDSSIYDLVTSLAQLLERPGEALARWETGERVVPFPRVKSYAAVSEG